MRWNQGNHDPQHQRTSRSNNAADEPRFLLQAIKAADSVSLESKSPPRTQRRLRRERQAKEPHNDEPSTQSRPSYSSNRSHSHNGMRSPWTIRTRAHQKTDIHAGASSTDPDTTRFNDGS